MDHLTLGWTVMRSPPGFARDPIASTPIPSSSLGSRTVSKKTEGWVRSEQKCSESERGARTRRSPKRRNLAASECDATPNLEEEEVEEEEEERRYQCVWICTARVLEGKLHRPAISSVLLVE